MSWRLALAALTLLIGCSNDPDGVGPGNAATRLAIDRVKGLFGQGAGGPAPFGVTRAGIADYPNPLTVITIEDGTRAGLLLVGQNGPWRSWQTLDGIGFTTRQGVLSATRALGPDLIAAEVGQTTALVRARQSGRAARAHRTLDGENNILVARYSCQIVNNGAAQVEVFEIVHTTQTLTETCSPAEPSGGETFQNSYWVGADGTIWRSEQWAGPGIGRVILEQLIK